MYNLLIVDDEPIITDSYFEYLSDKYANMLNIQKAYTPSEALQKAHNRVDILITDITMPRMDGYTLQKKICQIWPKCNVIFLTGNEEVHFAQNAIRQASFVDYVLKNEHFDVLAKAVNKAIEKIESSIRTDEVFLRMQKNIQLALPMLRKEFFMDVINGKITDQQAINKKLNQYSIELNAENPVILLGAVIKEDKGRDCQLGQSDNNLSVLAVDSVLSEHLKHTHKHYCVNMDGGFVLWFIQKAREDMMDIYQGDSFQYVLSLLDIIQDSCSKILKSDVSFVIADNQCSWDELQYKFFAIKRAIHRHHNLNESILIAEDSFELQDEISSEEQYKQFLQEIEHSLLCNDRERVFKAIDKLDKILGNVDLVGFHYKISAIYIKCLEAIAAPFDVYKEICSVLFSVDISNISGENLILTYKQITETLFAQSIEYNNAVTDMIKQVEEYIDNNLSGDLSLTAISSMVNYSPTYFSKLFKKVTGENFSDYILAKRLKKAQELLCETNMKVGDIAKMVGYESVPYFIKSFKRLLGRTPNDYRN